jgi:hypothetical protein
MTARINIFTVIISSVIVVGHAMAAEGQVVAPHVSDKAHVSDKLSELRRRVTHAESTAQYVLHGKEGWLFFLPEVRSMVVGPFWGESAVIASRSHRPEYADPLPAIVDFHRQLWDSGINLLVVPVPGKAAVYPEFLLDAMDTDPTLDSDWMLDANHTAFLKLLSHSGVQVLDLTTIFRRLKQSERFPSYCLTDTHWSGEGIQAAARAIADQLRLLNWNSTPADEQWSTETRRVAIEGDLSLMLPALQRTEELVEVAFVRNSQDQPVAITPTAEILLLGDSHTLVFHDPSLFALGAGLPDHLTRELGQPIDLIGVRGSGSHSARISLLRQKERLNGKKLVIWCFAAREFTEATDGWRKLPLPAKEP